MGHNAGAAFLCRYDGAEWVLEATLYASDPEPYDEFGYAVDVDGDVVVVGARRYMVRPDGEGSTYVFRHIDDDWIEEAKLIPSDGADGDHFGSAVALEKDTIIVTGKEGDALYYFHRSEGTWQERQIIEVPESPSYIDPTFIDLSGDRVIAGRPRDDDLGTYSGSAYVYERVDGAWNLRQKLLASDGGEYDCFGCDVGICGDTAFIGAMGLYEEGTSAWAYVFRLADNTWEEAVRLEGDWDYHSAYGSQLALDGDRGIVSAPHEGYYGDPQGAIYLYAGMTGVDCNNNGTPDGCDIFLGTSEDMNDNGIPDECECPADFDGDGDVDTADLLFLLGAWGTPDGDVDFDGDTDTADLLALLAAWGDCP